MLYFLLLAKVYDTLPPKKEKAKFENSWMRSNPAVFSWTAFSKLLKQD